MNKDNLSEYLDIDGLYKLNISPTLRSDIIRLELLYQYGGIWSDSSIIYNTSFMNIFKIYNVEYDIQGFYLKKHYDKSLFPVVESWLLASPSKSKTIENWRNELHKVIHLGIEKLLVEYRQRSDYLKIKNNIKNEEYFIVYLAQMASFLDNINTTSLTVYCADNSALYYQSYHGWFNKNRFSELCTHKKEGGVSKSMLKKNRLAFDKIVRCK